MAGSGIDPWTAWLTSPLIYGGAAQLVTVRLIGAGGSAALIVLSALVVNSRLLLYGASLAPHVAGWPARFRWGGAHLLVDPAYAVVIGRFGSDRHRDGPRERYVYYTAVGLAFWTAWQVFTAAGVLAAGLLPPSLNLDLAAPLTFLLLLLPMLSQRPAYAAAATGASVSLGAAGLPLGLGLLVGAVSGVAAGAVLAARRA